MNSNIPNRAKEERNLFPCRTGIGAFLQSTFVSDGKNNLWILRINFQAAALACARPEPICAAVCCLIDTAFSAGKENKRIRRMDLQIIKPARQNSKKLPRIS